MGWGWATLAGVDKLFAIRSAGVADSTSNAEDASNPSSVFVDLDDPRAFMHEPARVATSGLVYKCLLFAVLLFLLNLAANPIKELFSESPWIERYDPFYLVTAQGVFGWIGKIRPQLVMEYSHSVLWVGIVVGCF